MSLRSSKKGKNLEPMGVPDILTSQQRTLSVMSTWSFNSSTPEQTFNLLTEARLPSSLLHYPQNIRASHPE